MQRSTKESRSRYDFNSVCSSSHFFIRDQGPNSVVFDRKGNMFFTDSGPLGTTSLQSPKGSLFMISVDGELLKPILFECLAHPSGVALSPDEGVLYVAETMQNRVLRCVQRPAGAYHVRCNTHSFMVYFLLCSVGSRNGVSFVCVLLCGAVCFISSAAGSVRRRSLVTATATCTLPSMILQVGSFCFSHLALVSSSDFRSRVSVVLSLCDCV